MKRSGIICFMVCALAASVWSAGVSDAAIVRQIPNLASITFWETTSSVNEHTFGIDSMQLTTQYGEILGSRNFDFYGVRDHEFYDVFYSDADGSFNLDGEFITVEAVYDYGSPLGGGLNIAEISLNFADGTSRHAESLASFLALGDNADPGSVGNAVDGNRSTYTTMGNTIGQSDHLRITVNPVPLPGALMLLISGVAGLVLVKRRR